MNYVTQIPQEDQLLLLELVRSYSPKVPCQSVARKFGISIETVRQFCRFHRIPVTKKEHIRMLMMSDVKYRSMPAPVLAKEAGASVELVNIVKASMIYPAHDLASGWVDYMEIQSVIDGRKGTTYVCRCMYCGNMETIHGCVIEDYPNRQWCKCPDALAARKAKHDKYFRRLQDVYGSTRRSTYEKCREVLRLVRNEGYFVRHACALAGTHENTFRRWCRNKGLTDVHSCDIL